MGFIGGCAEFKVIYNTCVIQHGICIWFACSKRRPMINTSGDVLRNNQDKSITFIMVVEQYCSASDLYLSYPSSEISQGTYISCI